MGKARLEKSRRIAVLAETLTRGGAERQGYLLAQDLMEAGHRTQVISFWPPLKKGVDRIGLSSEFPRVPVQHISPPFARVAFWAVGRTLLRKNRRGLTKTNAKAAQPTQAGPARRLLAFFLARLLFMGHDTMLIELLQKLLQFNVLAGMQARWLLHYLQRERCDLLISFLPHHNAASILAGRAADVPVAVSERNDLERQPASERIQWTRSHLYPHADLITANSESTVQKLKELFPTKKVVWQPNKQYLPSRKFELNSPGKRIYVVSRLEPQKRIDAVISAIALLRDLGHTAHLVIYGEGPEEPRLRELASSLDLGAQLEFKGYVPARKVYQETGISGIFVTNSAYEGSSNALHEAVSAGLVPVVAADISEMKYILSPQVAAQLLTDGSPKDVADKLHKLLSHEGAIQDLHAQLSREFQGYWKRQEQAFRAAVDVLTHSGR